MFYIAICNNDEKERKKLEVMIEDYLDTLNIPYIIKKFCSGEELLETVEEFDLILLHIIMSGLNGIQVGIKLRLKSRNTKIIYITSYPQYFRQAINDVHTFAYLEKPVTKEILEAQLKEVLMTLREKKENMEVIKFQIIQYAKGHKMNSIFKVFKIQDIYYFECTDRKIKLKLKSDEYFFICRMKDLMDKMKEHGFVTCHQSYLVNLRYVSAIKGYDICLDNGDSLPLSQKRSSEFRRKFKSIHTGYDLGYDFGQV
ncbi:LytR/AlgR family response regulator transcription factor [Anaerocolumna jejuensis]|uniref:LytR/AlgR family response regulator transcription factor n=1 Tax=Anaerocolumna jejuensis TaxID=259063 RepID=UPI003F7BFDFE